MLSETFPQPFRRLLAEFDFEFPEKKATCDDCLMARSAGGFAYKPNLKCCTFFPFLSNFQVGAILSENFASAEIKEKLKSFIETDQAQPLGVAPDQKYQKKFIKREIDGFGRDPELLCPYLDKKQLRCGIWSWRGGVCTSFYCESSFGLKGIEFWRDFEKHFLNLEKTLSYDALLNIGFDENEAGACLDALPKEKFKPFHFKSALWCEFTSKKENLFKKTYEYVSQLSIREVQNLMGEESLSTQNQLYQRALALSSK